MACTVVVLQSAYLPWKGYFDLMHDADRFVFYDDVQFTKNDWRNRNRIKTPQGVQWLTVPVGAAINRRICDVSMPDGRWQRTHWRTLEQNYGRAPHFARYRPFLEDAYLGRRWTNLSTLNRHFIEWIARDCLGMTCVFDDSRAHPLADSGSERLLGLLRRLGATRYVSGPAARAYIDESAFSAAGVELVWKSYAGYPEYPQPHPPFDHRVSVLDLLFSVGPAAPHYIWGWRGAPA